LVAASTDPAAVCPAWHQLEEVAAKVEEIGGLATAAAARERRIEQLQGEVAQLEGQVASLPPPGDTGEYGAARSALLREQNDVAMQVRARVGCGWVRCGSAPAPGWVDIKS
jgi:hypothetical protein